MAEPQQYSLRWSNYFRQLTYALDTHRFNDEFVDVSLLCDGRKIKAHKVILSACSSYFKEILTENPHPHPLIIFKFIKYEDLNSIIKFMYQGEVNVEQDALQSFLQTAELLAVHGLNAEEKDKSQEPSAVLSEHDIIKSIPRTSTVRAVNVASLTTQNADIPFIQVKQNLASTSNTHQIATHQDNTTGGNTQQHHQVHTQNQEYPTTTLTANKATPPVPSCSKGSKKRRVTFSGDGENSFYTIAHLGEQTLGKSDGMTFKESISMDIPEYVLGEVGNTLSDTGGTDENNQAAVSVAQNVSQYKSEYEILMESEIEEKYQPVDNSEIIIENRRLINQSFSDVQCPVKDTILASNIGLTGNKDNSTERKAHREKLNKFCFVCGKYTPKEHLRHLVENALKAYNRYFLIRPVEEMRNVDYAPKFTCITCCSALNKWWKLGRYSMPFGLPMVWSDPGEHDSENCYVCKNNTFGLNRNKRSSYVYKGVPSAQVPVPHSDALPVPVHPSDTASYDAQSHTAWTLSQHADFDYIPPMVQEFPSLISQEHLDRIVRKLKLSKNNAMSLASELKSVNILAPGVKVTSYKNRQEPYMPYFMLSEDATYAYCQDIPGLMNEMGISNYNPTRWRLFIDASTRSLKVALLFEDSSLKPVPLMYAIGMKESYDTMKLILDRIIYDEHNWRVNCDFKVLSLLAGMQTSYTKYMCIFCKWDSHAKCNQYEKRDWPKRDKQVVDQFNVVCSPLIPLDKIMLTDLHIKLGVVKDFIKRLVRVNENALPYLKYNAFSKLSIEKIQEGVLNGPDIRKLLKDANFTKILDETSLNAWDSIRAVIENVLCKNRSPYYRVYVDNMMQSFDAFGVKMSLKIHMLHAHFDFYERQMSTETDETDERFYQTIMTFEDRFAGKRIDSMLSDFCWSTANEK